MESTPLISTLAVALTGAWLLGLLARRLKLSPIVGYLLAGVLTGPHTPGFVGDLHLAEQLAEVGVILLMFGVGLHFHIRDLTAVKGVAIPGALGQSAFATVIAMLVFAGFGMPLRAGLVIGMAMAVASTVVLMRVLMDADQLKSPQGHVAVGWLLVEDMFTVVLLVLLPMFGPHGAHGTTGSLWVSLAVAMLKLVALVAVVLLIGSRAVPWVLVRVARLRSRELFTLTVLVFAIAIAAASYYVFGASMALGAFLAGIVVAQSPVSHQAAADALPMRDAFAVLFFVSVGMLFDPAFLIRQPLLIVAALGIILIAKPMAALGIVALLGHSARTALTVAVGLAQIGEFSFILSDAARQHGLMTDAGQNVLVASAILSIGINPTLFRTLPKIESWLRARPRLWGVLNGRAERQSRRRNKTAVESIDQRSSLGGHLAVVVGYGPVGRSVDRLLRDGGLTTVVIDLNLDAVSALNAEGRQGIYGDASHETILAQAGVRDASHVLLTIPDAADRAAIVTAVRNLNPNARVLVRARYLREREDLERAGVTAAVFEEAEAAVGLARLVLADTGVHHEAAERKVRELRLQLIRENMANLRTQRVRSVMVPWTRVHWLPASATREEVLRQIATQRFSRWPVVDPQTGTAIGYLLTKDLIAVASDDEDWKRHVRRIRSIRADDDIDSTLVWMQDEGATVSVVQDGEGKPIGFITFEDILEQVVGRIQDEYPLEPEVSLIDALKAGGLVLDPASQTRDEAIRELAIAIPADRLPPGATIAEMAIERENDVSTDLGVGVAIPHARCADLGTSRVVFGRWTDGVVFSHQEEPVRLAFLIVTPTEKPEAQLALLGQLATVAGDEAVREALVRAETETAVLEIIARKLAARGDAASGA